MVKKQSYNLAKGLALRALRAFVAGFVASAVSMPLTGITSWSDLNTSLINLSLAGIIGGISALLMAVDKYFRV